jgi:hypothetical protein
MTNRLTNTELIENLKKIEHSQNLEILGMIIEDLPKKLGFLDVKQLQGTIEHLKELLND